MRSDPIEEVATQAACRVLTRRASALRVRAGQLVTIVADGRGRPVRIVAPEAVIMLGTAELFENCAANLAGGAA